MTDCESPFDVDRVLAERTEQDAMWGEQNHDDEWWLTILTEEVGELAQSILHARFGGPKGSSAEAELIQVAAVALAWIECKQRRWYQRLGAGEAIKTADHFGVNGQDTRG